MKIQILGVCGTFMAGIAVLAKQLGHTVIGYDQAFYEPMNGQLRSHDIILHEGYNDPEKQFELFMPDLVIVGNAIKRGNPMIEWILNHKIPYISGPEWLYQEVLSKQKIVFAVAGTHGKTTTSSMLAWVLSQSISPILPAATIGAFEGVATRDLGSVEDRDVRSDKSTNCGREQYKKPGFLIGGIPQNFGVSAQLGDGEYFVIEADEYDTAFFDKRSKFVHYHPDILIINNLEYDHADIFPNLAAIQTQFHHLIRSMPSQGHIIRPLESSSIDETLAMGCWSHVRPFLSAEMNHDGSTFVLNTNQKERVTWNLIGQHNVSNALAVLTALDAAGFSLEQASQALSSFKNVKRRLETRGMINDITVYDDFAHHPTAIAATLGALRAHVGESRIIALLHFASNSMKMGIYHDTLGPALKEANVVMGLKPQEDTALDWINDLNVTTFETVDNIVSELLPILQPNDHILVMSNGNFQGIHEKILTGIENHYAKS